VTEHVDNVLLPDRQLQAALLAPVRMVLTVVICLAVLLLAFWAVCLFQYFGAWQHDTQALARLFHGAADVMGPGQPLAHMSGWAAWISGWLHHALFVVTGVEGMQHTRVASPAGIGRAIETLIAQAAPFLRVVIVATQVYALRLTLLLGMLPLVLLLYLVARTDGHAERAIRRACAGRESASLYHRAKYARFAALGLLLIGTLCLPVHVDPVLSMLAFAVFTTVLARVQVTYYKKYQ
jgi:integrating conjugative element membrane protein (TIGR03747 family)